MRNVTINELFGIKFVCHNHDDLFKYLRNLQN